MTPKIYIVDKSKRIPIQLAKIISDSYEVKSSQHPDIALLEIIDWKPDLLITGLEIGNITGLDLCTILKMIPELSGIPIILLSSQDEEIAIKKIADIGVDYYIKKDKKAFNEIKKKIQKLFLDQSAQKQSQTKKAESILLVDDSILVRTMLANMLRRSGIAEIIQAQNGEEALQCLSKHNVDFVLSDYHMPILDGPQLVKIIRQTRSPQDLPIIIATGEQQEGQIQKILDAGANGVLIKPISMKSLQKVLNAFASGTIFSFGFESADDE